MAILAINFTAAGRRKLGNVLFIIHLICASCGIAFFGLGIYIKIRISTWMQLIDGYNDNLLPLMMVIVGTLLVVVDISGGRLVKSVENTSRLRHLLLPYLVIAFILSLCILTAGSICFVHRKNLSSAFHRGLTHAMERYQSNNTFKTKIDYVQIEFECCGNLGYEDWFDIQWVNNKYIDLNDPEVESKMTNGRFLNDDVPFSCCDPAIFRHCIHHHIHDNDMHYNYDYRTDLTIFPEGCKAKLMDYYSFRLGNVGAIVMTMYVMQVGIIIGLRYLQTAVHNSQKDPEGDSKGWLFKRLPTKTTQPDSDRDVESGDAEEDSGSAASAQPGAGSESYEDSFDSDSFESDDRTGGDAPGQGTEATPVSEQQEQKEEPAYANLPFHEDKERMQEALQDAAGNSSKKESEKQSAAKGSKKSSAKKESSKKDSSKKDSKKDPPKKDSKKSGSSKKDSKSPKKETKTKSASASKKQSPTKKKTPSPKSKSKSVKKSPTKKKTSPKKSGGSTKKSKKTKMKNKNNNIEESSDESYISDTAPLLGKFYSSSEEEELCRDPVNSGIALSSAFPKSDNVNNNEGSPEVTWLLSRTQFYSAPQTFVF